MWCLSFFTSAKDLVEHEQILVILRATHDMTCSLSLITYWLILHGVFNNFLIKYLDPPIFILNILLFIFLGVIINTHLKK